MATITHLHPSQQLHPIAGELEAFLNDAAGRRGRSANTRGAYRCDLRAAAAVLIAQLDTISTNINAFLVARDEMPSTANWRTTSLSRFFHWAMQQGHRDHNPVNLVDAKADDEHLPRPIRTIHDRKALDVAIAAAPQPDRLMFTILRETGMRADEVLSFNVGDVTLDAGREGLRVREAKNGHARVVVLTPDHRPRSVRGLWAWLRDLGDHAAPTIPPVRSNRGTRVSYDALPYRWVQVCRAARLVDVMNGQQQPRYTIHQMRHTVGSTLITQ
jgi:integrase/recombinase XerD